MRRVGGAAAAVIVLLTLSGCASSSQPAAATRLELRFPPDITLHYTYTATVTNLATVGGKQIDQPTAAVGSEEDSVTAVAEDGTADLQVTYRFVGAPRLGVGANPPAALPITLRFSVAPNGRVTAGSRRFAPLGKLSAVPVFNLGWLVELPDHPVRVNDAWTTKATAESGYVPLAVPYDAHDRFDRFETIGGIRAAVVESGAKIDLATAAAPGPAPTSAQVRGLNGTADATTTWWLDPSAHELLQAQWTANVDATLSLDGSPPSHVTQQIAAKLSRIPQG